MEATSAGFSVLGALASSPAPTQSAAYRHSYAVDELRLTALALIPRLGPAPD